MNKYIVIIGGGFLTMPAYRIAREELGLGVIAVDGDRDSAGMNYADIALNISTKEVDDVVRRVRELASDIQIVGVFTCGADVEVTVAAVAEALGLPGVSLEVARRCNDKLLMHKYLDAVGFGQKPAYASASSGESALASAHSIGFPCIVKPVSNCASRGVQRLDNASDFDSAVDLALSFNIGSTSEVLVEECLVGSKHTVEMIAYHGEWFLLSIVDTHYISPRWPCETGLNSTMLSETEQAKVFRFAVSAAQAIGIDFGAHKVDLNLSEDGEIGLIELTARLSGGFHCQYASPLAYGSHDIRAAMRLAIGDGLCQEDIEHQWTRGAAVRAIFPPPGEVVSIEGREDALSLPGVQEVFIWTAVGERVGPYLNSSDRCAFVIADGLTPEEAIANAEHATAAIQIRTRFFADR